MSFRQIKALVVLAGYGFALAVYYYEFSRQFELSDWHLFPPFLTTVPSLQLYHLPASVD